MYGTYVDSRASGSHRATSAAGGGDGAQGRRCANARTLRPLLRRGDIEELAAALAADSRVPAAANPTEPAGCHLPSRPRPPALVHLSIYLSINKLMH